MVLAESTGGGPWYFWETKHESVDLEAVRREVAKLDRGSQPASVGHKPEPWRIKCSVLMRKGAKIAALEERMRQHPSSSGQPPEHVVPQASRVFRVESDLMWPDELVYVIPGQQKPPKDVAAMEAARQAIKKARTDSDENRNTGNTRHTLVQVGRGFSTLPFLNDFVARRDFLVDGNEYIVGDFSICVGICRVNPTAYVVVQIRHVPCALSPNAMSIRSVAAALGFGTLFPAKLVSDTFFRGCDALTKEYGPSHQAVEIVAFFIALYNLQN
mmetsp:Transcript_13625/g.24281  ORF Transcript_13625/g.24281 Transcript_13625/m.24281 type:complete len:271 (+) Transcript_13625:412-1224(+)